MNRDNIVRVCESIEQEFRAAGRTYATKKACDNDKDGFLDLLDRLQTEGVGRLPALTLAGRIRANLYVGKV